MKKQRWIAVLSFLLLFVLSLPSKAQETTLNWCTYKDGRYYAELSDLIGMMNTMAEAYNLKIKDKEDNGYVRAYDIYKGETPMNAKMYFVNCTDKGFEKLTIDFTDNVDELGDLKWLILTGIYMTQQDKDASGDLYFKLAENMNTPVDSIVTRYELNYTTEVAAFSLHPIEEGQFDVEGASQDKEMITDVQKVLYAQGYDLGTPDGIKGPRTTASIKLYERRHGLAVNGMITNELYNCIIADAAKILGISIENQPDEAAEPFAGFPMKTFCDRYNEAVDFVNTYSGGNLTKMYLVEEEMALDSSGKYSFFLTDDKITGLMAMPDMAKADPLVIASVFYALDPSCKNVGEGAGLGNEIINAAQGEGSYETAYFTYKAISLTGGFMMISAKLK